MKQQSKSKLLQTAFKRPDANRTNNKTVWYHHGHSGIIDFPLTAVYVNGLYIVVNFG